MCFSSFFLLRHRNAKTRMGKRPKSEYPTDFIVPDDVTSHCLPEEEDEDIEALEAETGETEATESQPAKRTKAGHRRKAELKYFCRVCDKGFSIQKYLDSHITNKHPDRCEINSLVLQHNGKE